MSPREYAELHDAVKVTDRLLAGDPMSEPLTYPGRLPAGAGLLADDRFLPMSEEAGPLGGRRVRAGNRAVRLADHLASLGAALLGSVSGDDLTFGYMRAREFS
ncbi:hypothetical protein, partial [Streptosporangium sp. NPDC048865]|uniref:hypothetical protein n=1 Tax=Streptosporangium sp. NPDC048865 TaxID=3155766 RepID=UPI003428B3A0